MDVRIVSAATLRETIADWLLLPSGNLDQRQELANFVKVALMTDALSDVDEIRPDPDSDDRRGWWADMDSRAIWRGWPIGCKNWLLARAKISDRYAWEGDTVFRIEGYIRDALQPLVDRRLCSGITVNVQRVGLERIDALVVVQRGPIADIELVFQDLWAQMKEEPMLSPYRWST
jgi:phage gp46-like protein